MTNDEWLMLASYIRHSSFVSRKFVIQKAGIVTS